MTVLAEAKKLTQLIEKEGFKVKLYHGDNESQDYDEPVISNAEGVETHPLHREVKKKHF